MTKYPDFMTACTDLLKTGIDHSDAELIAHVQDLYSATKPADLVTLFDNTANYTVLAWIMGGQEVARVSAQIERDDANAQFKERLTAMGDAHKEQIDALIKELEQERDDHARTIKAKQDAEQNARILTELHAQAIKDMIQAQTEARTHRAEAERLTAERLEAGAETTEAQDQAEANRNRHAITTRRLEEEQKSHARTRSAFGISQINVIALQSALEEAQQEADDLKTQLKALTAYAQKLER